MAQLVASNNERSVPLSDSSIMRKMPDSQIPEAYRLNRDIPLGEYVLMMRHIYGDAITLLTTEVAQSLVGKSHVYAIFGSTNPRFQDHIKIADPSEMLKLEFIGIPTSEMKEEFKAQGVPQYAYEPGMVMRNMNTRGLNS